MTVPSRFDGPTAEMRITFVLDPSSSHNNRFFFQEIYFFRVPLSFIKCLFYSRGNIFFLFASLTDFSRFTHDWVGHYSRFIRTSSLYTFTLFLLTTFLVRYTR